MSMKKSTKTEIVIPTWAGSTGPGYWGDRDYSAYDDQSSSFWVSLRGVLPGDRHNDMNDVCRAVSDIGLYVYATVASTVSIDLRLHDVSSMTLRECELRIKVMKRLLVKGKVYPCSDFARDTNVHAELTKAVAALGIKRAMIHHDINEPETFELEGLALKRISDCVDDRLNRMNLRQVA
ncbi:hypothetical protein [Rhodoferax fermentans]|nr:hypothetical protein [Rhodoferax fermentans]